ncbi:major facilitator superfamily domain-containing protein 6-B isoform X2 [Pectinophora gossypiella]|nr:major facilitator superfamily domain-containing protein 6-B isoform X2 [Pectinophora gossypiella]
MNCDMSSPKMWQTVCEHWKIPQYCYSNTDNIQYTSLVNNVTLKDNCAYIATQNVTLNGYTYTPHCHIGSGYVDVNEPCSLTCDDKNLSTAIGSEKANMTCVDEMMNYRLCKNDTTQLTALTKQQVNSECKASCDLDQKTPWRLMSICDGWGADMASTCHPKTTAGSNFPKNLSFVGSVRHWTALAMDSCIYMQLNHIRLPDGSTHYPICVTKAQYQMEAELFHTECEISCNNSVVNEIIQTASESSSQAGSQFTTQFWMFFIFMIINWSSQAVVVTFGDAICFNLLGDKPSLYGKQRLWGSVGWGTFSLLTGVLIDQFSDGAYKNYTVAFVLMFIFMIGDIAVSCILKVESTKMSLNIIADVGTLFASIPTFIYMVWTILVGLCTGLLWQFLFWHLEDIAAMSCDGTEYVKSLQGLVSAIQTFGGEIPFMFLSGYILRKLGHVNMMSLVLFAFGVRFLLYSFLTNAWWVLPIEMLQGITFGMFYPTMTSYANVVSPPGTETTVQGLIGAIFEGVGTSLGSFIGGRLYQNYGGWQTFQWFGIGSLIFCVTHIIIQFFIKDNNDRSGVNQGYSSVIRYEQPNDMVFILEDMTDGS